MLLGPFDGRVAAVVGDFVCTTPNQTHIFLPLMQNSEVIRKKGFGHRETQVALGFSRDSKDIKDQKSPGLPQS